MIAARLADHGGRQLDGSRSPFDQFAEIVDAVGDRIDVVCDGGITRGTHVLKALSVGAKACSGGRFYHAHGRMSERSGDENGSAGAEDTPPELDAQAECDPAAQPWAEHASTQKSFDSPSLFRRDGRRHARGTRGMGPEGRRAICARSLNLRKWIVGAARLSFEIGTLLNGKALVEDVAFDMGWRLERNAQALD